jgi:hypothetical protein
MRAGIVAAMSMFVIALIVVVTIVVGGLVAFLRTRRDPMGSPEVLDRVKRREQEIEARERREADK